MARLLDSLHKTKHNLVRAVLEGKSMLCITFLILLACLYLICIRGHSAQAFASRSGTEGLNIKADSTSVA